jgi:hypothetical protein
MRKVFIFAAVLSLCLVASPVEAKRKSKKLTGTWRIKTTLTAAQEAVNPNYEAGMNRIENWYMTQNKKTAVMHSDTSSGETINGQKVGKAWVFDQMYDTGYGIAIHMHIVFRNFRGKRLKGTIEARYYETLFNQIMGIDAWSFKGRKLRR